jgi:hypothetical protein
MRILATWAAWIPPSPMLELLWLVRLHVAT